MYRELSEDGSKLINEIEKSTEENIQEIKERIFKIGINYNGITR